MNLLKFLRECPIFVRALAEANAVTAARPVPGAKQMSFAAMFYCFRDAPERGQSSPGAFHV